MPLLIAAALAFAVLPPATSATNWGAGKSGVLADMCSACNEPQYWKSECTGDNQLWLVYIYSQVPANLRTSLTNSVNNDYNPIAGITGAVTTQSSGADVLIFYYLDDPMQEETYGTRSAGATYGLVNIRYHMWCKPHEIIYQTYAGALACWSNNGCRDHFACHELGHTLGLMHASTTTSCLLSDEILEAHCLCPTAYGGRQSPGQYRQAREPCESERRAPAHRWRIRGQRCRKNRAQFEP